MVTDVFPLFYSRFFFFPLYQIRQPDVDLVLWCDTIFMRMHTECRVKWWGWYAALIQYGCNYGVIITAAHPVCWSWPNQTFNQHEGQSTGPCLFFHSCGWVEGTYRHCAGCSRVILATDACRMCRCVFLKVTLCAYVRIGALNVILGQRTRIPVWPTPVRIQTHKGTIHYLSLSVYYTLSIPTTGIHRNKNRHGHIWSI